jgi:hypothetical protein
MNTKAFFDDFHIGTYFLQENARTEGHIRELKDCGIDLVFGMNRDQAALDLFHKYGVGAVVTGVVPGWFGGNGDNAGTMCITNTKEMYIAGIRAFNDHPAIIGIDMGDEPSGADFPYYGQVTALVREMLPDKFLYLNIYPSYGMLAANSEAQIRKELGAPSYREYLESYCENIDLPYLSFDHYVYTSDREHLFRDLETAASFCKAYGKKLFVVLQVNSCEKTVFISEAQLLFQAFSALAYGASAVSWACYSAGWWHNQVLDSEGNKTQQYEKLKKVNHKLRFLAEECVKYQWMSTERIHGGSTAEFDVFRSIVSSRDALLGKFAKSDGTKAIFLSLTDDGVSDQSTLCFQLEEGRQAYLSGDDRKEALSPDEDGVCRITLQGVDACFITVC